MATKHSCPNCGADVLSVRWNAGYQYCKSRECFESLGRKKHVTMFEKVPDPEEVDIDPQELDDVAGQYQQD